MNAILIGLNIGGFLIFFAVGMTRKDWTEVAMCGLFCATFAANTYTILS